MSMADDDEDEFEGRILERMLHVEWKISLAVRDHSHCNPELWQDESPKRGKIRTHCKICGNFLGYRPALMNKQTTKKNFEQSLPHRRQTPQLFSLAKCLGKGGKLATI